MVPRSAITLVAAAISLSGAAAMANDEAGAGGGGGGEWLSIVGVATAPHTRDASQPYPQHPPMRPGAWTTVFVRNDSDRPAAAAQLRFNGAGEFPLLVAGEWLWFETPSSRRAREEERLMPPGALDVWSFNAVGERWAEGAALEVSARDRASNRRATATAAIANPDLRAELMAARDTTGDGRADSVVVHLSNSGTEPIRVRGARVYLPEGGDGARRALMPADARIDAARPAGGIAPGGRGVVVLSPAEALPRVHGAVEVQWATRSGAEGSTFAAAKFWPLEVEVGAGWLTIPGPDGAAPITRRGFVELLRRLNVTVAMFGEVPGYSGTELEELHRVRMMHRLEDIDRYNDPSQWDRVHGIEWLGEPQYYAVGSGRTPAEVHREKSPYRRSVHPTTLTLSEEAGFAHYAGLVDFIHFDAYRITAPHADDWTAFERFADPRVRRWASPMESVGAKMRTLQAGNRPLPAAAWSQAANRGWTGYGDRERAAPTADEVRSQAWQALGAGAKSLYWYSLGRDSTEVFADLVPEHQRIGREIAVLGPLLAVADAAWWEQRGPAHAPTAQVDALAGPDALVVVAHNLDYAPSDAHVLEWTPAVVEARVPASAAPWLLRPGGRLLAMADGRIDLHPFEFDAEGALRFDAPVAVAEAFAYLPPGAEAVEEGLRARLAERLRIEAE